MEIIRHALNAQMLMGACGAQVSHFPVPDHFLRVLDIQSNHFSGCVSGNFWGSSQCPIDSFQCKVCRVYSCARTTAGAQWCGVDTWLIYCGIAGFIGFVLIILGYWSDHASLSVVFRLYSSIQGVLLLLQLVWPFTWVLCMLQARR